MRRKYGQKISVSGLPIHVEQGEVLAGQAIMFPGGGATPIVGYDFSTLALGGHTSASFQFYTGFTIARGTDSTVQTSASAIHATPLINDACIGASNATNKGLVLQPNTFNSLGGTTSPRNLNNAWSAGSSVVVTYPYADSPDGSGTGCSRANVTSGGYAPFGAFTNGTFSSWQRSKDAAIDGRMQQIWITAAVADGIQVTSQATNTWQRLVLSTSVARGIVDVCDARDYTASGGQAAQNRDVLVDYIQVERGLTATEAIPTAQTRRKSDQLSYPDASVLTGTSRLKPYLRFFPKHARSTAVSWSIGASSGEQTHEYLWSFTDANHYARIETATGKLSVRNGVTAEVVSTNGVTWAADDEVEIYMEVGNNVASVAKYRINGGAWTSFDLPTVVDAFAPGATPLAIGRNITGDADTGDTGTLLCRMAEVQFYGEQGLGV